MLTVAIIREMEIVLFILRIIGAIALLSFCVLLGWIMYRDMRLKAQLIENPEDSKANLILVRSESGKYEPGTRFPLRPVTSIGRATGNSIVIADDFASSQHALINRKGSQWWLEDLSSSNGTLLNGADVDRPIVIAAGDMITIGSTEFRLEI
ncbi:MAG: FHA domain-containing protein [Chloroflexota bacterium]